MHAYVCTKERVGKLSLSEWGKKRENRHYTHVKNLSKWKWNHSNVKSIKSFKWVCGTQSHDFFCCSKSSLSRKSSKLELSQSIHWKQWRSKMTSLDIHSSFNYSKSCLHSLLCAVYDIIFSHVIFLLLWP